MCAKPNLSGSRCGYICAIADGITGSGDDLARILFAPRMSALSSERAEASVFAFNAI